MVWSRRHGWIALGIAACCGLALVVLIASTAQDSGVDAVSKLLLVVVGIVALAATLVVSESVPREGSWGAWLGPRPVAGLLLAVLAVFSIETDLLSHFSPRPARESKPGVIERTTRRTDERLAGLAAQLAPERQESLFGARISRVWGEVGCAVTYRFHLDGDALTVDSGRRPPNTPPFHLVGTVVGRTDDALTIVAEQPRAARGQAATFTYWTNGPVERLRWQDRARPVPLDLETCA